jgi:hypothetical protein
MSIGFEPRLVVAVRVTFSVYALFCDVLILVVGSQLTAIEITAKE